MSKFMASEILKKLRLNDSLKALIINAPDEYLNQIPGLQYDPIFNLRNSGTYDFVQVFANEQSELEQALIKIKDAGKYDCLYWVCYPKGTGKIKSNIKRETVWKAFELINLRPVSQIAIDETWSALRGRPPEVVGK